MNATYPGFYRATITDNADPKGLGRVRLRIPQILGDGATGWAYPMGEASAPSVGTQVWATFEGGDISFPVFLHVPAPPTTPPIVPASKVDWNRSNPLPYVNSDAYWVAVAYGNERFVATNESGIMAVSTDGMTWSMGSLVVDDYSVYSFTLAYGNGLFVALTTSNDAYFSYDGYFWNSASLGFNSGWALAFANNTFLSVADEESFGTARAIYSTNGSTWFEGGLIDSSNWFNAWSIAYGSGKWVVGGVGSSYNAYVSSDEGSTWEPMDLPYPAYNVAYGDGKFIASSPWDGVYWSDGTSPWEPIPDLENWWQPSYQNGEWLLTNNSQDPNRIATSVDGITWSFRNILNAYEPIDSTLGESYITAYGNGTYVLVSYYGGQAIVGTQPA